MRILSFLRNLFVVYGRSVRGRCMIHDEPMVMTEAEQPTSWGSTEFGCPKCLAEKLKRHKDK